MRDLHAVHKYPPYQWWGGALVHSTKRLIAKRFYKTVPGTTEMRWWRRLKTDFDRVKPVLEINLNSRPTVI
jgi:hypothetical protein